MPEKKPNRGIHMVLNPCGSDLKSSCLGHRHNLSRLINGLGWLTRALMEPLDAGTLNRAYNSSPLHQMICFMSILGNSPWHQLKCLDIESMSLSQCHGQVFWEALTALKTFVFCEWKSNIFWQVTNHHWRCVRRSLCNVVIFDWICARSLTKDGVYTFLVVGEPEKMGCHGWFQWIWTCVHCEPSASSSPSSSSATATHSFTSRGKVEEEKKLSSASDHPQKLASTILSLTCQQLSKEHFMLLTINSAASVVTLTQNTWQVHLLSFSPVSVELLLPCELFPVVCFSCQAGGSVRSVTPLAWFLSCRGRNWSKPTLHCPDFQRPRLRCTFYTNHAFQPICFQFIPSCFAKYG